MRGLCFSLSVSVSPHPRVIASPPFEVTIRDFSSAFFFIFKWTIIVEHKSEKFLHRREFLRIELITMLKTPCCMHAFVIVHWRFDWATWFIKMHGALLLAPLTCFNAYLLNCILEKQAATIRKTAMTSHESAHCYSLAFCSIFSRSLFLTQFVLNALIDSITWIMHGYSDQAVHNGIH